MYDYFLPSAWIAAHPRILPTSSMRQGETGQRRWWLSMEKGLRRLGFSFHGFLRSAACTWTCYKKFFLPCLYRYETAMELNDIRTNFVGPSHGHPSHKNKNGPIYVKATNRYVTGGKILRESKYCNLSFSIRSPLTTWKYLFTSLGIALIMCSAKVRSRKP